MAGPVRVSDIIVPEVFIPYVNEETVNKSALVRSGIVVPDASLDELAKRGGRLIQMPFYQDLTGDDEVLGTGTGATDSDLTLGKITTSKDQAVLFTRGRAWGDEDLAKALAGSDPLGAIADMVANYWAWREQKLLIAILTGVFADNADNDSSDLISDIASAGTPGDSNKIGADAIIDAMTKLGDAANKLTAIAMHSTPYSRLQKLNVIDYEPAATANIGFGTYLGKTIIVDDDLPTDTGSTNTEYTTYLFGPGAVGRGDGEAPVPVETDRDSLAGVNILIHRRHFLLHPRGIKFADASVANSISPTNAECNMACNWDRVYEKKNIRIVKLITNG